MALDDLLADRQVDAGAFVLALPDQALEGLEDALHTAIVKADAVILDQDLNFSIRGGQAKTLTRGGTPGW